MRDTDLEIEFGLREHLGRDLQRVERRRLENEAVHVAIDLWGAKIVLLEAQDGRVAGSPELRESE